MQDLVSMVGNEVIELPFRPGIIVGAPPGPDCFDKSKSESMM